MRVGVIGTGEVGALVIDLAVKSIEVSTVVLLSGAPRRQREISERLGPKVEGEFVGARIPKRVPSPFRSVIAADTLRDARLDVVISCVPDDNQLETVNACIEAGVNVVSLGDSLSLMLALLNLDTAARAAGVTVVAGSCVSPALSLVLTRHAADLFDFVESISIGFSGTAGPECAARRSRALRAECDEWRDGAWIQQSGSSGTELLWFPDPLGAIDCGRGDFSEAYLLQRRFPDSAHISAKSGRALGPARRFRRTAAVPSGLRVEVEGYLRTDQFDGTNRLSSLVYGLVAPTGKTSAILSLLAARELVSDEAHGVVVAGDAFEPLAVMRELGRHDVHVVTYDGEV